MGSDDANEGNAPGACLEHDFVLSGVVEVTGGDHGLTGFSMVHTCEHCGALDYEPSNFEKLPHRRPPA